MKESLVYHYTNASTLSYILQSPKGGDNGEAVQSSKHKMLHFLGTDISVLNDRLEYNKLTQLIHQVKIAWSDKIIDEAINGFPFILSFSGKRNYLPMWRQYANDGSGICLSFNKEKIIESLDKRKTEYLNRINNITNLLSRPYPYEKLRYDYCSYKETTEIKNTFEKLKSLYKTGEFENNFNNIFDLYRDFQFKAAFLKDKSFKDEKEWRIVFYEKDCRFFAVGSTLIARAYFDIPIDCLEEIVLGPCASETTALSVRRWCDFVRIENPNIRVLKSRIPYRK